MKQNYTLLIIILYFFSWSKVFAQTNTAHKEHHDDHNNEIGIACNPVYFLKEKELTYGLHLHYVKNIENTKFGLGVGYERIFDDHKHQTLGVVGSYRPVEKLVFNVSPGVTFEEGNTSNLLFALHLETSYEFEIKNIHLGPAFEFAYDPDDYHLSLGLHIGLGF